MVSERGGNQSVERAAAVLNAFTLGRPALRVSDVAKEVGLGLSITSRLLSTLESAQLVRRDPVSQLYELGPSVLTMAGVALNNDSIYRQARPVAQRLAAELGLAANVAVLSGDQLFYLLNVEGHLAQKSFSLMGQRNPLHATGMGKCLLLGLSAQERVDLLGEEPFTAYTTRTLTGHEQLTESLTEAEERGYATEVEELALGRACLAAPVRNHTGKVVAALSLSGALSAIALDDRQDALGSVVIEAADTISVGLGYLGPVQAPSVG
ncbi:HTH-type transcriptional repressor AllR [Streptomyces sp. YIM 130001]|uniref:IclR family transcriptional regulator n=1 Tax=Streptomyces sp. YIM 130001 TaxID=2259644 RepID=UPI000E64DCDE|nr:IclR family transcriptional regulator [Streptomyces sp. YIM 130001]RII19617.1 HTH-type transcriptional repressor AllR [Streptomyces sp. YIM 130001]